MKPMKTAPRDEKPFVILTAAAAHNAEWDRAFKNFWSLTAGRAIGDEEALGWMSIREWKEFVLSKLPEAAP